MTTGPMTHVQSLIEWARQMKLALAWPLHDWETDERRGDDGA